MIDYDNLGMNDDSEIDKDSLINNLSFIILHGDDWEALYLNNELQVEGHKISVNDFVKVLQYETSGITSEVELDEYWIPDSWIDVNGGFPTILNEKEIKNMFG